jgi:hypothetical protein
MGRPARGGSVEVGDAALDAAHADGAWGPAGGAGEAGVARVVVGGVADAGEVDGGVDGGVSRGHDGGRRVAARGEHQGEREREGAHRDRCVGGPQRARGCKLRVGACWSSEYEREAPFPAAARPPPPRGEGSEVCESGVVLEGFRGANSSNSRRSPKPSPRAGGGRAAAGKGASRSYSELQLQLEQAGGVVAEQRAARGVVALGGDEHLREPDGLVIEGPVGSEHHAVGGGLFDEAADVGEGLRGDLQPHVGVALREAQGRVHLERAGVAEHEGGARVFGDGLLVVAHLREVAPERGLDVHRAAVPEHRDVALAAELVELHGAAVVGADELHRGVHLDAAGAEGDLPVELLLDVAGVGVHRSEADEALVAADGVEPGGGVLRERGPVDGEQHRLGDLELAHLAGEVGHRVGRAHSAGGECAEGEVALHAVEVGGAEVLVDVDVEVDGAVVGQVVLGLRVTSLEVDLVGADEGQGQVRVRVDGRAHGGVAHHHAPVAQLEPRELREVFQRVESGGGTW